MTSFPVDPYDDRLGELAAADVRQRRNFLGRIGRGVSYGDVLDVVAVEKIFQLFRGHINLPLE
jgi:hypothetical protein